MLFQLLYYKVYLIPALFSIVIFHNLFTIDRSFRPFLCSGWGIRGLRMGAMRGVSLGGSWSISGGWIMGLVAEVFPVGNTSYGVAGALPGEQHPTGVLHFMVRAPLRSIKKKHSKWSASFLWQNYHKLIQCTATRLDAPSVFAF